MPRPVLLNGGLNPTWNTAWTNGFTPAAGVQLVVVVGQGDTSPMRTTWRGVEATNIYRQSAAFNASQQIAYALDTSTSAGTVSGVDSGPFDRQKLGALAFSTVDTGTPVVAGSASGAQGQSSALSITIACASDELIVWYATSQGGSMTASGNTTIVDQESDEYWAAIGTSTGNLNLSWSGGGATNVVWFRLKGSSNSTLTVTTQPTTGTSGVALSPSLVVTSSDSGFTGNVTIERVSGDPTIGGTLTVAAVAGVATFANVIPTGTGSLVLRATAAGHAPVTFDAITVNAPAGTLFRSYFLTG